MTTTIPFEGGARQPRAIVKINGVATPGWISWEADNNSYREADTFRIQYSASALPSTFDSESFSTKKKISAEIFAGFPANPANPVASELDSLIYGNVDTVDYDPVATTITLTGRDLTSLFIDTPVNENFTNQTASQVATQLATDQGLTPVVTKTTQFVGTPDPTMGYTVLSTKGSDWDLITQLATQEGFICYVSGQSLYFEPDPRDVENPYQITWYPPTDERASPVATTIDLSFSRAMQLAAGIRVEVRAPNRASNTPFLATYPPPPFQSVPVYHFTRPRGTQPNQLAAYALRKYLEITSHAVKLSARLPADNVLSVNTPVRVTGTGTAFDQIYFPRNVVRQMSLEDGYLMTVEAQNSTPDLTPASVPQFVLAGG